MTHPAATPPLISIIVPVHNVADYVGACIDSLRTQTLSDFECLVIDDGSTDDSAARAAAAIGNDPRFSLIQQQNKGLSGARNTGLDRARGAFIAFVDSDDRVMPDYLMQLWRALEDTGCDWVACGIRFSQPDGSGRTHSAIHGATDLSRHTVPRRYALENWSDVIRHFPSAWNKLYRATLIKGLRFDEDTWFEDHGFFQRAALRTDHLLHLPQALYFQTQGRVGQITNSDDDRVFQQFQVLIDIRATMRNSDKPGADIGFSRLASRLLFERSTALRDPIRRARFAAEAAAFLTRENIDYSPDGDSEISLSWAMEMAGAHPLSVVIPWQGGDPKPLHGTLQDLAMAHGPAHEVLVICASRRAAEMARNGDTSGAQFLVQPASGEARARNHGLKHAKGAFVVFLRAGDRVHPWALLGWCDAMLQTDADFGISGFRNGLTPDALTHSGFLDHSLLPGGRIAPGLIPMAPMLALSLETDLSAKIIRRSFVQEQSLYFTDTPRSTWVFCLTAALMARRVTCIPWAGVQIAPIPQISGPTALWRSHGALVRALPAAVTAQLPEGWQRRLFGRGLYELVQLAKEQPRRTRLAALAGATLAARRYRIDRQAGAPAGLDPSVGPRLSLLFDPVELIRRSITARRIDTSPPPPLPTMIDGSGLRHFPVGTRGFFQFRADFHDTPYANLSFFDQDRTRIPFHLSLRLNEGLAVCNDWHDDWGVERCKPMVFDPAGVEVTILLTPPTVTVWIDGVQIFRFGRPKLRRRSGFRNLNTIAKLETQGGIHPREMVPQIPESGQIHLDERLQLCVGLNAGDPVTDIRLCYGHTDAETMLFPVNDGRAAIALLQGHLWQGLPANAPLRLELNIPGQTPRPFEIDRAEMVDRLGAILSRGLSRSDGILALTLLEHLRHGDFLAALTPALQDRALALAGEFDLEGFLVSTDVTNTALPVLPSFHAPEIAELDTALAQFIHGQRHPSAPDPLTILRLLDLPVEQRRGMFFALSEYFTMPGQDFDGFARMAQDAGLMELELPQDRWSISALLPFLLCAGLTDDLRHLLHSLIPPGEGWILTPPLAWVAQRAMVDETLNEPAREDILRTIMAFVDTHHADYWERTHCRELTRAAVALLAYHPHAPAPMQKDIVNFCLRAYGVSRVFWDMVKDSGLPLPPRIALAATRFSDLRMDAEPQAIDRALRLFERAKCSDATRLRHELLGPAYIPTPDCADLIESETNPAQIALRHMAFPGSSAPKSDMSQMLAHALPLFYPQVPQAPNFEVQRSVARDIAGLLDHPETPPSAPWLDNLMGRLALLSSQKSGFLGFGLALAMITGLGRHPQQGKTIERLHDWLILRHDALPPENRQALYFATALHAPLAALRDSGLPQAAPLLEAFAPAGDLLPIPAISDDFPTAASPLFDAIVTVFSCVPNLETRIPALRSGWLSLLKGLGIPYVVMVGNGDGQRHGDVVHLDAADDYEGLPQKTLAAVRWVHDNTRFAHMIKVDDDCFLNAPLFFQSLSYRKFDYYGRRLTRAPGQMDRAWHQAKSSSQQAQTRLDKSPEPSSYADGGSVYALSRTAMAAALAAAASDDGQRLIDLSFMEDKLLGDLLALRGIHVAEEDYRVSIRRRTHPNAIPVAAWHNSFLASQTAPVQMVHLDSHHDQAHALKVLDTPALYPRKIWPTWQPVKLGYQTNTLELVSDDSSVMHARNAEVAVVACMRNEMFMLPHFLAHYRRLGVDSFLIADNCSDDGTLEYLADQPDVALFSVDTDYRRSHYGVAWQQALLAAFRIGKWSLVADADELLVWQQDQRETLPALLARPEFKNAEAVRLFMLDMYPDGALANATFDSGDPFAEAGFADRVPFLTSAPMRGPFSDQPAWTSALRHRLIPGTRPNLFTAQKAALVRYHPFMRLSEGMHFVGDAALAPRELILAHFKYNADFRRKAQTEVARRQHFNDAEEYHKYLALASEGRDVIYDSDLSVRWYDSPFVRARLDQET